MTAFIEGLPKAELHLHIEGTIEPETMFRFAERNRIALPYRSVEALRAAYRFGRLQDFLDIYYQGMAVLRTEEDYYEMTWAYLEKAHDQNVLYAEIFFDPQAHTSRGIAFETVLEGISRALEDGRNRLGLGSRLIMCFLRDREATEAMGALEQVLPHRGWIIGVGSDSAEKGNPPAKFRQVFERARARVTVNENFAAAQEGLSLSDEDLAQLARNSFEAAFLPSEEKQALVRRVDEYVAAA